MNLRIVMVYVLACFIWGSTWLAIRINLESLTPFISSGLRFITASLLVFIFMKINRLKLQTDKAAVKIYVLMTIFSFALPFAFIYWGELYVPSGLAAVLFAVYPFFIAIFSYFIIPGEEIDKYKIIGMLLGFAGIVVIFSDQFGGILTGYFAGMAAIVSASLMQASVAVVIKKYGHHLNPLSMNLVLMGLGGFILLAAGLLTENTSILVFDEKGILPIFYLALFGSLIAFTSYYWLLKRINIIILSLIAFITPIIALLLGGLVYNEKFLIHHFIGSVLVLIGLLTANTGNFLKSRINGKIQTEQEIH